MPNTASFFEENGYYLARGVFHGEQLQRLQSSYDTIVGQLQESEESCNAHWASADFVEGGKDTVILHTHQVQSYCSEWMRAFMDPSLTDIAQEFLGPNILLHHSKLFYKPPGKGAPFPLHQDCAYFPSQKDQMIAAVIHLSDSDEERGCLRVVPGSHKLGQLDPEFSLMHSEKTKAFIAEHPLESATPMIARAGDVLFFHYCTLHGSMPNFSDQSRKTVLLQMIAAEDELSHIDRRGMGHPYSGVVLCGQNHFMSRSRAAEIG